jgi:hypothetical protein
MSDASATSALADAAEALGKSVVALRAALPHGAEAEGKERLVKSARLLADEALDVQTRIEMLALKLDSR